MQKRPQRVAHLIQQVIGEILISEVRDRRLNQVVITDCKVTNDLKTAHIYYTLLSEEPKEAERAEIDHVLCTATSFLRRQLGGSIRMRYVPQLAFHFDETLERARRLEQILSTLHAESQEEPDIEELTGVHDDD